jgi:hypothetical protein
MRMRNKNRGIDIVVAPTTDERYLYFFVYLDKGLEDIKNCK